MSHVSHRVLAALYLSDHVPELINHGKAIVQAMTGNNAYPNPTPALGDLANELAKLEQAELATKTKAVGTFEARNAQQLIVETKLRQLEAYVQMLADSDLTHAAALITGAVMSVSKPSTYKKPELAATQDTGLGLVHLVGRATKGRVYYEWEWSTDQTTWHALPRTFKAKTSFAGFTPMTTYAFRFRPVTPKGTGAWSAVVTLLVK